MIACSANESEGGMSLFLTGMILGIIFHRAWLLKKHQTGKRTLDKWDLIE